MYRMMFVGSDLHTLVWEEIDQMKKGTLPKAVRTVFGNFFLMYNT